MIRPVSPGKISHGRSCVKAKNSRSQWARYSCHFWSARRSSIEDLISTIQISPRSFSATRSARRPDGSGNSLTQENPSERNSRAVPRAIASAVSDCRRSGAGTRATVRAGDSIAGQHRARPVNLEPVFTSRSDVNLQAFFTHFPLAYCEKSALFWHDPANQDPADRDQGKSRRRYHPGDAV